MKFDWKKLYSNLNDLRKECGASWRELGHQSHLPPSTFTRIKQGRPASVENLIKMLTWAKKPFKNFIKVD